MKAKRHIGKLLQFYRCDCDDDDYINGYVLDVTEDWTLIQFVDQDIFFNGYNVFRNSTVDFYLHPDHNNHMIHRALQKMGYFPKKPKGIDLTNLNTILHTANDAFPLIVVHREYTRRGTCRVGGIANTTDKTITLAQITPGAKYGDNYRIRSEDVTMIEFGGRYESALWAVASKQTKNCITKECKRRGVPHA